MTASEDMWKILRDRVFYREYFEYSSEVIRGKRVAVVDDSVQQGAGLAEEREYFENRGALVDTFAFVGHQQLLTNDVKNYDLKMKVKRYLPDEQYRQYLLLQALHLMNKVAHYDMDHIVLELSVTHIEQRIVSEVQELLFSWGYTYDLYPLPGIQRFTLFQPSFYCLQNVTETIPVLAPDFVEKIRFTFSERMDVLTISPLVFPKMLGNGICPWSDVHTSFSLPCQHFLDNGLHKVQRLCYLGSCIYLSVLLGKEFLLHLRDVSQNLYAFIVERLEIRSGDLIRYFGRDYGRQLAEQIKNFLVSTADESLSASLRQKCSKLIPTPNILSNEFVPNLLANLRTGYERLCREKKTRLKTHYTLTTDELLSLKADTHPFSLSEIIDENCDFGYLVPSTEQRDGYWRRTYRTGEPTPAEMSVGLIALAISWMGTQEEGVYRAQPETVLKALANFCYDFPCEWFDKDEKDYRYLHTLIPVPSYWGTEVFLRETDTNKRLSLYHPEKFSTQLARHWVVPEKGKHFFATNKKAILEVEKSFRTEELEKDKLFIDSYFRLLRAFKERTRTDDSLNALCLSRDKEWLFLHVNFNLDNWSRYFGKFLGQYRSSLLRKVDYSEPQDLGPLHQAAREAYSASDKVSFPNKLRSDWMPILRTIAQEDNRELSPVLEKIENEFLEIHPEDKDFKRLTSLVQAIAAMTDLTLAKAGFKKDPDERVYTLGARAFSDIGYNIDAASFIGHTDREVIFQTLLEFHKHVGYFVEGFPHQEDPRITRRNAYYAKRDHSFIASKIREGIDIKGWSEASFLAVDLSKSTWRLRDDHTLQAVRGEYYQIVIEYLKKFQADFKEPEGDDYFMALFGADASRAMKAAFEIQQHFKTKCNRGKDNPQTIMAKFGLSILQGKDNLLDLQKQNTAMAIAKDCCVLKKGFINESDIICPEEFRATTSHPCAQLGLRWNTLPESSKIIRGDQTHILYKLEKKRS